MVRIYLMKNRSHLLVRISLLLLSLVVSLPWEAIAQEAASQVFSPAPANPQGGPGLLESLLNMLPMLAICYLIFWTMVIRPQETKTKKHKEFIEGLKRGDAVVTSGGLYGKVAGVESDGVMIEIAPNVKVKVQQSHLSAVEAEAGKSKAA